jgi:hypothetical protein
MVEFPAFMFNLEMKLKIEVFGEVYFENSSLVPR